MAEGYHINLSGVQVSRETSPATTGRLRLADSGSMIVYYTNHCAGIDSNPDQRQQLMTLPWHHAIRFWAAIQHLVERF